MGAQSNLRKKWRSKATMTEDPHEEGAVCDFCEIPVEPEETLEPIYVGELPQSKPHRLSEVWDANLHMGGAEYDTKTVTHLLGRPVSVYVALWRALEHCSDVDIDFSTSVEEIATVGGETGFADLSKESMPSTSQFESRTRDDAVSASVKIRPKDVTYEPDAEVCDTCAEMFSGLNDE